MLTHPSGKKFGPTTVRTSIDGKGIAVYSDAFVLSVISITAHKVHFRDSILTGGPWTVEKFIKQKDEVRTIWLTPEPYLQEFVNVDSITGKPIPGVKNIIKITRPDGTSETVTETGNRNGVFPISAKEDDRVEIISEKAPEYKQKRTVYPKFKDVKDKKVRMSPETETLTFRTLNADKPNELLPSCNLQVTGSVSGGLQPSNSGNGSFSVTFRRTELLTIVATKSGYKNTTDKVNAKSWTYLKDDQERRDIPLKRNPLVFENKKGTQGAEKDCYNLEDPGDFVFEWRSCDACTMLIVTDGNGNVIGRFGRNSPRGDSQGQQYSPPAGSTTLRTPTPTVCVTRTDVNGCACWYRISRR
jgi:hypothetical protein